MGKTKIEWTDETKRRFWSYVAMGEANDCWIWQRGCFQSGYGQFRVGAKKLKAHRVAFELTHGRPPVDLVLHYCDVRPCCNPSHFFEGSHADNVADRDRKGRGVCNLRPMHGESNGAAKLCTGQVLEIRAIRQTGQPLRKIAKDYGISASQVGNIVRGELWQI